MNRGFSVEEDIDFSDDDIDFLGSSVKKPNISSKNEFVNTKNGYKPYTRNEDPCPSRATLSHSKNNPAASNNLKSQVNHNPKSHLNNADFMLNDLLNDNEDDEFLSQIDLDSVVGSPALPLQRGEEQSINGRTGVGRSCDSSSYSINNNNKNSDDFQLKPNNNFSDINDCNNNNHAPVQSKRLPVPFCNDSNSNQNRRVQLTEPCVTPVRTLSNNPPRNSFETPTIPSVGSRKRENPMSTTLSKSCPKQRRFPGPAGLLPTLDTVSCFDKLKSPINDLNKQKRTLTPIKRDTPIMENIMSSSQDDDFKRVLWSDVTNQVSMLFPSMKQERICDILRKATVNQLNNGKVSLLCGMIKSFSTSGSGGKLIIKDPTGEINGTLHKNVLDEYESDLCHGSGVILKDVSVYSPSLKKHYINIIPSNIVQIFPAEYDMSSQSQQSQPEPRFDKENLVKPDRGKHIVQRNSKISELRMEQPRPSELFSQNEDDLVSSNIFLKKQNHPGSDMVSQQPGPSNMVSQQPGPSNMLGNENELNSFFSEEFF